MNKPSDTITQQLIPDAGWYCAHCKYQIEYNPETATEPPKCGHCGMEMLVRHVPVRVMTPAEELERLDLNRAKTSENMRKRVIGELGKGNGKAHSSS